MESRACALGSLYEECYNKDGKIWAKTIDTHQLSNCGNPPCHRDRLVFTGLLLIYLGNSVDHYVKL